MFTLTTRNTTLATTLATTHFHTTLTTRHFCSRFGTSTKKKKTESYLLVLYLYSLLLSPQRTSMFHYHTMADVQSPLSLFCSLSFHFTTSWSLTTLSMQPLPWSRYLLSVTPHIINPPPSKQINERIQLCAVNTDCVFIIVNGCSSPKWDAKEYKEPNGNGKEQN